MRFSRSVYWSIVVLSAASLAWAGEGNRLAYLDEPCDPYYAGLETARLVTPQWIGEQGVETALVLAIDDMRETGRYETFLRPIIERLKKIDGRGPVSIMTNRVDPNDPQLDPWYKEGVNLETHTYDHPCPCLGGGNFDKAKATYDQTVDLMKTVSNGRAVAFRMPCCDSMNSASPRFYAEIFNKTTPAGNFQKMDSSVMVLFTPSDPALPRELVMQDDRQQRFRKYLPTERKFINYVEDYPYPYVIARLCWEMPTAIPDDWQGINLQGNYNPITVGDMKAAIDAAAIKQGIYVLTFHPGGWIRNDQVIDMIDHVVEKHGKKAMFLNFREAYERLTKNLLGGEPLRTAKGQDNGVRLLDVNNDGYMDVVIGNQTVRQTRIWQPETEQWTCVDFPVEIVSANEQGDLCDAGVRFGVLQKSGQASFLVRNEKVAGLWHFAGGKWEADAQGMAGLEAGAPVATARSGRDLGVRLRDLDRDGVCELIVGNPRQQAVFQWLPEPRGWRKLPFALPAGAAIVDAQGRDAGFRLVDIDEDGHPDVVFSNAERYSLHLFSSMAEGWSRKVLASQRSANDNVIPMIVRADGTNNGTWFKYAHLWVQNEDVGERVMINDRPTLIPIESRSYATLLKGADAVAPGAARQAAAQP